MKTLLLIGCGFVIGLPLLFDLLTVWATWGMKTGKAAAEAVVSVVRPYRRARPSSLSG